MSAILVGCEEDGSSDDFDSGSSTSSTSSTSSGSSGGSANERLGTLADLSGNCGNAQFQLETFVANADAIYDNYLRCINGDQFTTEECNTGNDTQGGLYEAYEIAWQESENFFDTFCTPN
jgi:hypothetical protein